MPISRKIVDEIRPRSWSEFIGQDLIVEYSKRWIDQRNMPDVICVGPPGSGKTTWIKIMASNMFGGVDVWSGIYSDLLVLNASDDRGIDVVRTTIKDWASAAPQVSTNPFRILVLEEGDKLTKDAQDALRSTVEDCSATCRFIYSGNDDSYIDAIKSRCAMLRFNALPLDKAMAYFQMVASKYKVKVSKNVVELIAIYYEGDIRRMFNDCLEKLIGIDHEVTIADLDFTSDVKNICMEINKIMESTKPPKDKYFEARKYFTSMHSKTHFNLRQFLKSLHDTMGPMAFDLAEYFSEIDDRLRESERNKEIHVGALLARIAKNGKQTTN